MGVTDSIDVETDMETGGIPTPSTVPSSSSSSERTHHHPPPCSPISSCCQWYWSKWKGIKGKTPPPAPKVRFSCVSMIQATISITLLGVLDQLFNINGQDCVMLIASFGASAVILHSTPYTFPIAQPYNVVMGHVVSAIAGVTVYKVMGNVPYIASGLAVGLSIFLMEVTNSIHPPGGATAYLAVAGSSAIHRLGYTFVIFPGLAAALIMVFLSTLMNNFDQERAYPQYWKLPSFLWLFELQEKMKRKRRSCCERGTSKGTTTAAADAAPPSPTIATAATAALSWISSDTVADELSAATTTGIRPARGIKEDVITTAHPV